MTNFLVTGCSSGIGRGVTYELIRRGHRVWGVALEPDRLKGLRGELKTDRFNSSVCDVTQRDSVRAAVADMERADFRPDVVILSAGINPERFGAPFSSGQFEEVLRVNVLGVMVWIDLFLPLFENRRSGKFVAISSYSAYLSDPQLPSYCASKAALNNAFESLRRRHSGDGVRFVTVNLHTVAAGMGQDRRSPFRVSLPKAVNGIVEAIERNRERVFIPAYLSVAVLPIPFLPTTAVSKLHFWVKRLFSKSAPKT